jgi:hypothetical protein
MGQDDSNQQQIELVESEADILTAHQLDLIGQIEHQLRCVHNTMRHIEKNHPKHAGAA